MKTLLDIMKDNLPAGATIKNEKETTNRFKYDFCAGGLSVHGDICKAVAPGYERTHVARVIATHMSQLYLMSGDIEQAKYWLSSNTK